MWWPTPGYLFVIGCKFQKRIKIKRGEKVIGKKEMEQALLSPAGRIHNLPVPPEVSTKVCMQMQKPDSQHDFLLTKYK